MRRYFLFLATLTFLLIGCREGSSSSSASLLKVTDGAEEKSYDLETLEALGGAKATFQEVTYKGVPLRDLLADAGFDVANLSAVKATAADGFSANYGPDLASKPDTLVAYAQAGGPLAEEDGTFRMVLPGQEGKLNPRDLVEIRVYP